MLAFFSPCLLLLLSFCGFLSNSNCVSDIEWRLPDNFLYYELIKKIKKKPLISGNEGVTSEFKKEK